MLGRRRCSLWRGRITEEWILWLLCVDVQVDLGIYCGDVLMVGVIWEKESAMCETGEWMLLGR